MRSAICLVITIFVLGSPVRARAQCAPEWDNPFVTPLGKPTFNTGVNFDPDGDGPIPTLSVFAGSFVTGIGQGRAGVAGWDGAEWKLLGPAFGLNAGEWVSCSAVMDDDGPGPHLATLWMGGNFSSFAGITSQSIVRYSNGVWMASGATPVSIVSRMAVLDEDGAGPSQPKLCIQGTFAGSGERVAILAGDHWEFLGGGPMSGGITGLLAADLDGDDQLPMRLIVVGDFSSFSGADVHHVAQWTGAEWESIAGGTDGVINAAIMHHSTNPGDELFVVGNFSHAGGVAAPGIARLHNGAWLAVENPLAGAGNGIPMFYDIVSADDDGPGSRPRSLLVSGNLYTQPASMPVSIFRAQGESNWTNIAQGLPVSSQLCSQANMNYGGIVADRVFTPSLFWNGQSWMRYQYSHAGIVEMKSMDLDGSGRLGSTLVVAGFGLAVSNPEASDCVAQWNGAKWLPVGGRNIAGIVNAVAQYDIDGDGPVPPRLLAAGRIKVGGHNYGIVSLDENGWTPFANSEFALPNAHAIAKMAVFDADGPGVATPVVIVTGQLADFAEPSDLFNSAMWNGLAWSQVGTLSSVNLFDAFHVHDVDGPGPAMPALFAGLGSPNNFFPASMGGMVRWDGTTWTAAPDVQTGVIQTGDRFMSMCSLKEPDGTYSLCVGSFGPPSARQWKNGQWSIIGANLGPHTISSLAAHDDGTFVSPHPTVYFTGNIGSISGSTSSRFVGQWNGSQWIPMGSGLSGPGQAIASVDFDGGGEPAELFVSGNFTAAGGVPVNNLAAWRNPSPRFLMPPWSRTVAVSSRVSLKFTVTGQSPLMYQWRKDGQPIVDGGGVSGSTTRELIIDSAQTSDIGDYVCVVTNVCGLTTCTPAHLHVCAALPGPDVNHDGAIDGLDISPFVSAWQTGSAGGICTVDLNANGAVDSEDLQWFIGWLLAP